MPSLRSRLFEEIDHVAARLEAAAQHCAARTRGDWLALPLTALLAAEAVILLVAFRPIP